MVVNTKILLARLEEYQLSLRSHLDQVRYDFKDLERRWHFFSSIYEGDAADQFRAGWNRTTAGFESYVSQSQRISEFLEKRIEALRETNRPEGSI
jgi:hypothetical protein